MLKGQKCVRKGRRVVLAKPVLTLVVGRQLAGPTSILLKQISKGVPIDASGLSGVTTGAAAVVP